MVNNYCLMMIYHHATGTNPMSSTTSARRLLSFFSKPRGPSAKPSVTRIQRRARDLMSLASMAGVCAVVWWLMIGGMVVEVSTASSGHPSSSQQLLEQWNLMPNQPARGWLLALIWLLAFVATMAPIVCLRRLGNALYTQAPLSLMVARRFQWLGNALAANIFFSFVATSLAAREIKDYQLTFSLGFLGTFIAATLAYVVAEIMREGAWAVEENREFV